MKIRKRVIGDLYLAASIIFIFLSFLYFGFKENGFIFLIIGLILAFFGINSKKDLIKKEYKSKKKQ